MRPVMSLVAAMLVAGCDDFRASRARSRVPRIVVVSMDTLHVGRVGPYNPDVETTPVLDRLAAEGVRFDNAYTQTPITLPSHAVLLTGVSSSTLGVMANGDRVPDSADTLAEILGNAGYRTGAFITLGVLTPVFGVSQGFEDFHDPFVDGPERWYRRAHEIIEPVKSWLDDNREEPFFLWVHFSDPHEPYVTPDAPPDTELWLDDERVGVYNLASAEQYFVDVELQPGKHRLRWTSRWQAHADDRPESGIELMLMSADALRGYTEDELPEVYTLMHPSIEIQLANHEATATTLELHFSGQLQRPPPSVVLPNYDKNVATMDRYLGELVDKLDSLGIGDETLLVLVSDHGEGLFEHDIVGHASHVYEDQLRIVWMMRGAGLPEGHVIADRPGLMIDVAPTILDIVGLSHSGMEGRSWVGCWESNTCPEPEPFWAYGLSHETRGLTGMASYRWPYKWMWRRGLKRIAFDVASDPWEEDNLLEDPGPHNPAALKESAEAFRTERRRLSNALHESGETAVSSETERLLESLGYIGGAEKEEER